MPIEQKRDKKGKFYRYGKTGKRYYYTTEAGRKTSKRKAMIYGYAIQMHHPRKWSPRQGQSPHRKIKRETRKLMG